LVECDRIRRHSSNNIILRLRRTLELWW